MKKIIFVSLGLMVLVALPTLTFAANEYLNWMENTINNTPVMENADLIGIIFKTIQYLLAFLGVVAVVVILIGGFMWMTAAGNDEKVGKAKKIIVQGLIGLIIVLLAFAIATFVIQRLTEFAG